MFAYCNNNPVSFVDSNGQCLINITVDAETEVVNTTKDAVKYKTVITITHEYLFGAISYTDTCEFFFTVGNNGFIAFDNAQKNARYLNMFHSSLWKDSLAAEMIRVAQKQVPDALQGRTVEGVSLELELHYYGHVLGIKAFHTDITNIGGNVIGKKGYDENADWFEHPVENLFDILAAIL